MSTILRTDRTNPMQAQEPAIAVTVSDRSLDSLDRTLRNHDRRYQFQTATARFSMRVGPDTITIGDSKFGLNNTGWAKLAGTFGAPPAYWDRLEPAFRAKLAQHHFDQLDHLSSDPRDNQMDVVALDGGFFGFRSSAHMHLGNVDVLRAIRDGLGADAEHFALHRLQATDESVSVELVTPRNSRTVEPGDDIQGGITVSHSITGQHATTVDLYILRLICKNGMALRHCVGHTEISRARLLKRKGDGSKLAAMDQIERLASQQIRNLDELLDSFSTLPTHAVARNPGATAEEAMREFMMPLLRASHLWSDRMWRDVLSRAWRNPEGGRGELTEFSAVNAITHVATHHLAIGFRQRRTLARLAGLLAYRRVHVCPQCHRALVAG